MTVSSTNSNSAAYSYLQSLLQGGQPGSGSGASAASATGGDPVAALLNAFYPDGNSDSSPSSATGATAGAAPPPPMTSAGGPSFSPDAMSSLISTQEGSGPQSLFSQMDTDGDGQVSQKEFENVFGANADTSKVDGLFKALDSNGDGSIGQSEFASAVKGSHSHHVGHGQQAQGGGGGGGSGGADDLLSGADATGAKTQTVTAADGSTTTTVSYADGTSTVTTTPATPVGQTAGVDPGSQNSSSGNSADKNSLTSQFAQLVKLQAQFLTSAASTLSSTLATV